MLDAGLLLCFCFGCLLVCSLMLAVWLWWLWSFHACRVWLVRVVLRYVYVVLCWVFVWLVIACEFGLLVVGLVSVGFCVCWLLLRLVFACGFGVGWVWWVCVGCVW